MVIQVERKTKAGPEENVKDSVKMDLMNLKANDWRTIGSNIDIDLETFRR